nr:hypothetical protein [Desulfobacterales bacterium]
MNVLKFFKDHELGIVNEAVAIAEELIYDAYKLSFGQWKQYRYDIKTLKDLGPKEIVSGPFAQIVRYLGCRSQTFLSSSMYDFYVICLQDHNILTAIENSKHIQLFPFVLYIVVHELIHIVRFTRFLQNFHATPEEKLIEETRVHGKTYDILKSVKTPGMNDVLNFYKAWHTSIDSHLWTTA